MGNAQLELIRDLGPDALEPLVREAGEPAYRAGQLGLWLYRERVRTWSEMTNLPAKFRAHLSGRFRLEGLEIVERQVSEDGTRKVLFALHDGQMIESVIIPMDGHRTFCISSQVGCAMGCTFCATARGGLARNLSAGEIVEQVIHLDREAGDSGRIDSSGKGFNIVFMGMGEPLDNFEAVAASIRTMTDERGLGLSQRRITLSTSGSGNGLRALLASDLKVGLTVSLNSTTDETRRKVMPKPGRTPLAEIMGLATAYAERIRRPATIAYVLLAGINDSLETARELAALVRNKPLKVNLIPLNEIGGGLAAPEREKQHAFQAELLSQGIRSTLRDSGGRDIDAACGQLRAKRKPGA